MSMRAVVTSLGQGIDVQGRRQTLPPERTGRYGRLLGVCIEKSSKITIASLEDGSTATVDDGSERMARVQESKPIGFVQTYRQIDTLFILVM